MPLIPKPGETPSPDSSQPTAEEAQVARYRDAAMKLGMDYDAIPVDQRDFIHVFAEGGLDSLEPGADPENPLIPADDPTLDDGATPSTDVDGNGVGPGPETSDAGEGGDGSVGSVATPPVSAIPPTIPPVPAAEPSMQLPDGTIVTASQLQQWIANQPTADELALINARRQGLVAPQFIDPATGLPIQPAQQQNAQDEWIDPAAQAAYTKLQQQLAGVQQTQQQLAQSTIAQQQMIFAQNLQAGVDAFKAERAITDEQVNTLLTHVNTLGLLPVYARQYPGDPRSAIAASLDAVYWNMPENRSAFIQQEVAKELAAIAEIDKKKSAGGAIASSTGNVSRVTPPPRTRNERDAAMVQFIEAAQREGAANQ